MADAPALGQLWWFLRRCAACMENHAPLIQVGGTPSFKQPLSRFSNPVYVRKREAVALLLGRAVAAGEVPEIDVAWWSRHVLAGAPDEPLYNSQRRETGFAPERALSGPRELVAIPRAKPEP